MTPSAGPFTNLRRGARRFLGRDQEFLALERSFRDARLVTIVGPPGVGKTRLAREYGAALYDPDGSTDVWFVDLASAERPEQVARAVLKVLRGNDAPQGDIALAVAAALSERTHPFLVLDNLEQALAAARVTIDLWLDLAPVSILATSRERLYLDREQVMMVRPLTEADAALLFLERIGPARVAALSEAERAIVVDVVRRLDGLPLAIELAAARIGVLTLAQLRERLAERFALLRGIADVATPRQQTLQAALDWSWALLDDATRIALAQAAVFRGGFTIEAAEAVIDCSAAAHQPPVIDLLQSLVEKSLLVKSDAGSGGARFVFYESVREYGAEKLSASGELAATLVRHARYFADAGGAWAAGLDGVETRACAARLVEDLVNLEEVCERAAELAPELAARAALAMSRVFQGTRSLAEQLALIDRALVAADRAGSPRLEAELHLQRAEACGLRGVYQEVPSDLLAAEALTTSGQKKTAGVPSWSGDIEQAVAGFARAHRRALEPGATGADGKALHLWTTWAHTSGTSSLEEVLAAFELARTIYHRVGARRLEAIVLTHLGIAHADEGADERALTFLDEAIHIASSLGDRLAEAGAGCPRANVLHLAGRLDHAEASYRSLIEQVRALGAPIEWRPMSDLALLLCERGQHQEASRLAHQASDTAELSSIPMRVTATGRHLAIRALLGDPEGARAELDSLAELHANHFPWVRAMLEVLRTALHLAEAHRRLAAGERAAAVEATRAARASLSVAPASHLASLQTRLIVRWLEWETERVLGGGDIAEPERRGPTLEVGPGISWFRIGTGAPVDLTRRPVMRRLVGALTSAHRQAPGQPVGSDALIAATWPGQVIAPDVASERLWVTIGILRKLGMQGAIRTVPGGYLLSADIVHSHTGEP